MYSNRCRPKASGTSKKEEEEDEEEKKSRSNLKLESQIELNFCSLLVILVGRA